MRFNEHFDALDRLDGLIRRKQTGTPAQLAAKFGVSVGTIKNMIKEMKDRDCPIRYSRGEKTYYYTRKIKIIAFQVIDEEDL